MSTRASIRDVARQAGVSHTTASLALRGDPRISAATRRRVVLAARQLDYRPHAVVADLMAQLRTLKIKADTVTLGFITAWPTRDGWEKSPNHRRFFAGVQARARELGYKVEEFWLREPGMTSRRMSQILRARGIRGLILQSLPKAHGHLSLEWRHFTAVAKGVTVARPRLHRVISSHFEDMRLVGHHLKRLGYRRPGLVLDAELDARVDRAWLAAYLLHQHDLPARDRVPGLIVGAGQKAAKFARWFAQHRPEVILFTGLPLLAWIKDLGLRVPEDVGLVHLDWSEEVGPLAGIDAEAEMLGAAAVDLLVGQLHAHEYGIPAREKIVAVSGRWIAGASLRRA
jgi:LacI family transcriptional regulator